MEVKNTIYPNRGQIEAMLEPGPNGPIYVVNLLRYKERAEYGDGRDTDLTGREAFGIYSDRVTTLVREFGGDMLFHAPIEALLVGEVEELWDDVGIGMYPSRTAMLKMVQSDEMRKISVHREAGLAAWLSFRTANAIGTGIGVD